MVDQCGGSSQDCWFVAKSSYKSHVLNNPKNDLEDPDAILDDPDHPDRAR